MKLNAELVTDMKLQFPALQTHLVSDFSVFLWGYLLTKACAIALDTGEELWHWSLPC
jgi:hypothetical protein